MIQLDVLHSFNITFHTHSNIVTQTPNRKRFYAVAVNRCLHGNSGSYSVEDIMNKLLIINNPDLHLLRLTELHRCGVNKAFLIIISCPSVVLCACCAINIHEYIIKADGKENKRRDHSFDFQFVLFLLGLSTKLLTQYDNGLNQM